MCPPILAAASALLSIGSAGVGFAGAQQQADAQNAYYRQNAKNAQQSAVNSYADIGTKREQVRVQADQNAFDQSIEALQKRGTAVAAAGEAGVSGLSVDAVLGSLFAQEGQKRDRLDQQYAADGANLITQGKQVESQAQSRINSVQRAADPSPLSFIIQGLSGAVGSFSKLQVPGTGTI